MLISGTILSDYVSAQSDLRINLPSGVLVINDGTTGGAPISGINYGLPSNLVSFVEWPSGIEGNALRQLMNEFPDYSRISSDKASVGGQILSAGSAYVDQVLEERDIFDLKQFVKTYPKYEQGVVYEWNYNDSNDLDDYPAVQGKLGNTWFDIPLTVDENWFWKTPPTRLETTNCEISGLELLGWTQIASSGLNEFTMPNELPLYGSVYFHISGAGSFSITPDANDSVMEENLPKFGGYIEVRGVWLQDDLTQQKLRTERIPIQANGVYASRNLWKDIKNVKTFSIDPQAYIKATCLNFNPVFRGDNVNKIYPYIRGGQAVGTVWQRGTDNTQFRDFVQPERSIAYDASSEFWLVKTRINTDTISDEDIEFSVEDWWKITDASGTALSGVVDFVQVPWSKYILALTPDSKAWVIDTYKPALDMSAFKESQPSPVRIEMEYPKRSAETLGSFSVELHAHNIVETHGVERYRWKVHHGGQEYILDSNGTEYTYTSTGQWQPINDLVIDVQSIEYTVSGTGQYTFELETVTDDAELYRTFTALNITEKKALGYLPINGLSAAPSGIDFDGYERPWVTDGTSAVRLVMRTDIATWDPEERLLLTRELYDDVRRV